MDPDASRRLLIEESSVPVGACLASVEHPSLWPNDAPACPCKRAGTGQTGRQHALSNLHCTDICPGRTNVLRKTWRGERRLWDTANVSLSLSNSISPPPFPFLPPFPPPPPPPSPSCSLWGLNSAVRCLQNVTPLCHVLPRHILACVS